MENWERRVQPLMKRERKGPTLRGVTHQVVEVPVSLHEKGGGIVTSYFVNTGFKKKKAVLETFLRRESHHTQSFKGKCFLFFFEWWIICCCLFFDTTWKQQNIECRTLWLSWVAAQCATEGGPFHFLLYKAHQMTTWDRQFCALNMPLTFKIISVLILFSVKLFPQENNFLTLALPVRAACSLQLLWPWQSIFPVTANRPWKTENLNRYMMLHCEPVGLTI